MFESCISTHDVDCSLIPFPTIVRLVGGLFLLGYVLVVGSGVIAGSSALNALSDHGACTVWYVTTMSC